MGKQSVKFFREEFARLDAVSEASATGEYRARYVGPVLLRALAKMSNPLLGLPGWIGKRIDGNGHAVNRLKNAGVVRDACPMIVRSGKSMVDGGQSLILSYPTGSPWLLRFFSDELRQLDNQTILGFAVIDLPLIRASPLPFLLHKVIPGAPQG